jgi:RNA polymerase sigma-70 factor (ECF subfamily)
VTVDGIGPTGDSGLLSDESLLRGLAKGDSDGLSALYERYGRLAYGLAYRMLADGPAAEDVVQEAFVSAWRNAPSFNPERGTARAWLLTTVRNRCIDVLRGPRRSSKLDATVDDAFDLEARDNVLESVLHRLQAQDIQSALDRLPEEQRTAVHLAYFGGLTHAQIAAQTRVPLGTVKGRMRLALDKLREVLTKSGGVEPASEGL